SGSEIEIWTTGGWTHVVLSKLVACTLSFVTLVSRFTSFGRGEAVGGIVELEECLALVDLGASINLMPLSVWQKLSLPELTSTRMTLELANQSTVIPTGVAEDAFVKVRKILFPTDFVVFDYDFNPRAVTFKVRHTSRYSSNSYDEMVHQVNVIDVECEKYAQEVLGFLDCSISGNPTPSDPIIASLSPSFTLFKGSDYILEEIETFIRTSDELTNLDDDYYDTEGDVLYLENLLNEDPSPNLPSVKNEDLKQFGTNKLAVIISKELEEEEKAALLKRSISRPVGVAEDVFVKVRTFHFSADFVFIDFDVDPRVPLIPGRSFLKTGHALIDVYEGELTLHVGKEAVTFNLDQTSRYSANCDAMSVNRIDLIDVDCKEYSQEVLRFFMSGNPTPSTKPIVSISSPTLTPFGDSDFLLEETNAFLAIDDEPISSEIDDCYYDSNGDILLLEEFLNDDPSSPPLPA
nr:reverse transcriptase domain-containing protein [Tanacetum cinerariifolium]